MDKPTIVVGVDGSPAGTAALAWAVRQARTTGARVHAVSVCRVRPPAPGPNGPDAFLALHQRELRAALDQVDTTGVEVEQSVPTGSVGPALVELSTDAHRLVLGSHTYHHGPVFVVSPVVTHCLRHARCPVVVVPAEEDGDRLADGARLSAAAHEFR
ncbi:universal stress protein [Saccharothrix variisporea]|uniref:Nucleotide-binding universal stress UspA family protein n=1 Tax=Saccharothrix variisporea TaxID=543527 RepID=A0A495XLG7_9PSEU|nr:universal stress protein [Saccharothrix variisporea]RKT74499.1 nucleotide-binding universal stress UspA family protein [Saccharothrix variisporea]